MKKIITITSIALISLLFTACSKSPYDFSSEKAFQASVFAQAKKEGVSEAEALNIILKVGEKALDDALNEKYTAKGNSGAEEYLNMMKDYFGSKTLKQLKAEVEK